MNLKNQYAGVWKIFSKYWRLYGGTKALLKSPYMHLSLAIGIISYPYILNGEWATNALEILPNLLGFSLGGYAMLLAFSNEKFLKIITRPQGTALSTIGSSFVHFIIFQLLALIFAYIYKSSPISNLPPPIKIWILDNIPFSASTYHILKTASSAVGGILLIYSLMTAVAATMSIFRVYTWYEVYLIGQKKKEEKMKQNKQ